MRRNSCSGDHVPLPIANENHAGRPVSDFIQVRIVFFWLSDVAVLLKFSLSYNRCEKAVDTALVAFKAEKKGFYGTTSLLPHSPKPGPNRL